MNVPARIDTRCAARRLGVSVFTIRRWIKSGILPAVRAGKCRYLIDPGDLDKPFTPVVPHGTDGVPAFEAPMPD